MISRSWTLFSYLLLLSYMKDENKKEFNFTESLGKFLIKKAEKEFGYTARLNEILVYNLTHSEVFTEKITSVRKELEIPQLEVEKDIGYGNSKWVEENLKNEPERLKKYIKLRNEIFTRFGLPFNFQDWLEDFILYQKSLYIPKYLTLYRQDFIFSKSLPPSMRITTQEKKFYLNTFRGVAELPKTGRIPKALFNAYKQLDHYVNSLANKNKKRKLKNIDLMEQISNLYGIIEVYLGNEIKLNYLDVAGRIYLNAKDKTLEADKKRAQKLRKIAERYKKQIEFRNP